MFSVLKSLSFARQLSLGFGAALAGVGVVAFLLVIQSPHGLIEVFVVIPLVSLGLLFISVPVVTAKTWVPTAPVALAWSALALGVLGALPFIVFLLVAVLGAIDGTAS